MSWPMRWARSAAWSSTAGFHHGLRRQHVHDLGLHPAQHERAICSCRRAGAPALPSAIGWTQRSAKSVRPPSRPGFVKWSWLYSSSSRFWIGVPDNVDPDPQTLAWIFRAPITSWMVGTVASYGQQWKRDDAVDQRSEVVRDHSC
ncbi:MAG TPA: hypothetical protein VN253_18100 [Kofleriaceae bacterium]|nr:hypothetical protein [Kofleriaceae bacterium]